MPAPRPNVIASTRSLRMPIARAMPRFCDDGADLQAEARAPQDQQQQAEDHQREPDDVEPVVGDDSASFTCQVPLIHDGVDTARLLAVKTERTSCCSIRLTPKVASSVSSGRP